MIDSNKGEKNIISIKQNPTDDYVNYQLKRFVDNLSKRIKTILTKTFLVSNNKRSIDKSQNIIDIYWEKYREDPE